ncbi:MAG: hypothetical protein RSB91_03645 [Clostridia bacterium]
MRMIQKLILVLTILVMAASPCLAETAPTLFNPEPTLAPGTITGDSDTSHQIALKNVKSGKVPAHWGDTTIPKEFWEKLDSYQFNADTAEGLIKGWIEEYSADMRFWPVELRALIGQWVRIDGDLNSATEGMPLEGDIPVEEAEKIAWDTYRKLYQEAYDTSVPAFFRLYTVFWINDDGVQGRNRWYIQFVDPTRVTGQGSGQVLIDAKTGEVLVADVGLGGNG